jgi:acetyl esterase
MACNQHLIQIGDSEYDDRMSEESRLFVKTLVNAFTVSELTKQPMPVYRNLALQAESELNKSLKFENLEEPREILIKNPVDGYEIPATIFAPIDVKKDTPIIVYYHGGGWTIDSRQSLYQACASMASKSKTVWVSIEYRLAPEHKFKTQLSDYKASFEYVEGNRERFSSKRAKIGVAGDSAGGHIAAILAHEYKSKIDFQILIYACVDLVTPIRYKSFEEFSASCYLLSREIVYWFFSIYLEDSAMAKTQQVSPIYANDFSNLPKCLQIAAELDPLIEQNKAYHEKILQGKSSSELKIVKGTVHGFFSSYCSGAFCKEAFEEAQNYIIDFLDKL